jgi:hypothetical protein
VGTQRRPGGALSPDRRHDSASQSEFSISARRQRLGVASWQGVGLPRTLASRGQHSPDRTGVRFPLSPTSESPQPRRRTTPFMLRPVRVVPRLRRRSARGNLSSSPALRRADDSLTRTLLRVRTHSPLGSAPRRCRAGTRRGCSRRYRVICVRMVTQGGGSDPLQS